MVNVTEYLKNKGSYDTKIIHRFLRMERVKYFIGHEKKVESKPGRTGSYTLFSQDLFDLFILWLDKKPIPLLNRKEYEVADFIASYYDLPFRQYELNGYLFDWYIPEHNLLIEFNEATHAKPIIKAKDEEKQKAIGTKDLFVINEKSAMVDLANLVKQYPLPK